MRPKIEIEKTHPELLPLLNQAARRNCPNFCWTLLIFNYDCYYVQFSHNQGKNLGAHGVTPLPGGIYPDAAIDISYDNYALEISDNDLEEGKAPVNNGIAFTNIFVSYSACESCDVSDNRIKRFPGNGIMAEDGRGTVYGSSISGNQVEDNGQDGILIEGPASSYNYGNLLFNNEARGNTNRDCEDDTQGSTASFVGTLGTANTWFNSTGSLSYPKGLCTPRSGHINDSQ